MKRIKYLLLPILLFVVQLPGALAQSVKFYTQLSAGKVGVQDQLQVSYVIENADEIVGINSPDFASFRLLSGPNKSTSTNISIGPNGTEQSSKVIFTYVVQPSKTGRFTLPALFLKTADGNTFKSQQTQVEVIEGSVMQQRSRRQDPFGNDDMDEWFDAIQRQHQQAINAMQQQMSRQRQQYNDQIDDFNDLNKNLFLRVTVDKTKAYVGEQINASYKLYARVPMQMAISKMPSLNGFWTQDFAMPKEIKPVREILDGIEYEVFTLKKSALFPQQSGKLVLDEAEADGIAQQIMRGNSHDPFGGFFDDVFGGAQARQVPVHLKSKPVAIQVMELPTTGKPDSFSGAVGKFTARLSADKTAASTDEVITLKYIISGSGNLKLITPPKLHLQDGLSALEPAVFDTLNSTTTLVSGQKIITYTITPIEPGEYKIKPLEFSFFNPAAGKYETIISQPLSLNIEKGKHYKEQQRKRDNAVVKQIRPLINGALPAASQTSSPIIDSLWFKLLLLLPLLALLIYEINQRIAQNRLRDISGYKLKTANKLAIKRLKQAKLYLNKKQKDPFYEEIAKALWLYVSDKTKLPLAELSKEKGLNALKENGISENLIEKTATLSDAATEALYAPNVQHKMQNDYEQAVELISLLEEEWKQMHKVKSRMASVLLPLFMLLLAHSTMAQETSRQWQTGIQAYQDQNYTEAIHQFENAAAQQPNNAAIWYNLGNAYFKNNQFPLATLAFKRSLLYHPQNSDAQQNLLAAQSRIQGIKPMAQQVFFERWFQTLTKKSNSNAWALSGLVILLLSAYFYYLKREQKVKFIFKNQLLFATALTAAICLLLSWMSAQEHHGAKDAVVIAPNTTLTALNKKDQSKLVAGTIVTIHQTKNDEAEVSTADGQRGWLPKKALQNVQP